MNGIKSYNKWCRGGNKKPNNAYNVIEFADMTDDQFKDVEDDMDDMSDMDDMHDMHDMSKFDNTRNTNMSDIDDIDIVNLEIKVNAIEKCLSRLYDEAHREENRVCRVTFFSEFAPQDEVLQARINFLENMKEGFIVEIERGLGYVR